MGLMKPFFTLNWLLYPLLFIYLIRPVNQIQTVSRRFSVDMMLMLTVTAAQCDCEGAETLHNI